MKMPILREDLKEGDYLLIKDPKRFKVEDNVAQVVHIGKTASGEPQAGNAFGVQIPGWTGKDLHDLQGHIPKPEGYYFTISEINNWFELAPMGIVPVSKRISFDSVILEDRKKEQIIHAMKQIDFTELIFTVWGFEKTFEKGRGVSMLFYGPPGTGKTLMAQAIAHKLEYKLMIISNADIQSSVPGEAERNIRKYFKDNKGQRSVLLFDECDSLIYSRAGVGAILGAQINELLSQLERFDGVTIFTTNRLGALDEAVNRRLSVKVEFAMPNAAERVKIWKRMFPAEAPLAGDISWTKLAKHEIAGGHIKNAVLRAAREAAVANMPDKDKKITMEHLSKGLKAEVDATKEFERAKNKWEGRYRGVSGLSHDGGSLKSSPAQDLKTVRKNIEEMKSGKPE